jgi:predicted RNA-binding Zn-ribbon protein involved in translation (DUF1610 family)
MNKTRPDLKRLAREGICPNCGNEMDYVEETSSSLPGPYYECDECGRRFDAQTGDIIKNHE